MRVIASIDQGTTSSRCILFDASGSPVSVAQQEHAQITPRPGWVEHDPMEIARAVDEVCGQALRAVPGAVVEAIGITNQRETVVFWDRRTLEPACHAIVWQDTRTADLCSGLAETFGRDRFREKTGLPVATYFSGPKIRWALDHDNRVAGLARSGDLAVGTIDSWLIATMSAGAAHVTDRTNASRTLLMNLRTGRWDADILGALSIDEGWLPRIVGGGVLGETGSASPFGKGIPIAAALGDQQAALVGQACLTSGTLKNTYGTGCFLLQHTGERAVFSRHGLLTTAAHALPEAPPGFALEGSIAIAGALVQWLRDGLGVIERAADIESLAASVEDSAGVTIVPAFNGLFAPYWDAEARGLVSGLTRGATKAHLARAALEAVCFQTRDVVEALALDTGTRPASLRVDGGMVANDLLMQLQADLLGVPIERPRVIETTALGAAFAAGLATGFYKDASAIEAAWSLDRAWEPRLSAGERDERYAAWKRAVERARG